LPGFWANILLFFPQDILPMATDHCSALLGLEIFTVFKILFNQIN
jgi:hypothetical protein